MNYFRVSTAFLIYASLAQAGNDSMSAEKNEVLNTQAKCRKFLDSKPDNITTAALTIDEQSYLSLVEVSLQKNFISTLDAEKLIHQLEQGKTLNPLDKTSLSSEALPFKRAFAKLIKQNYIPSHQLIAKIHTLLTQANVQNKLKMDVKEESREFYQPTVYAKIKIKGEELNHYTHVIDKAGHDTIVLNNGRYTDLINVNKPDSVSRSMTKDPEASFSLIRKNGEMLTGGTDELRRLRLTSSFTPDNTIILNIDVNPYSSAAQYILTQDGREIISVIDITGDIHFIDLAKPKEFTSANKYFNQEVNTTYFISKSGKEVIAAYSGKSIQIININDPTDIAEIIIPVTPSSSLKYFKTKDGRELISYSAQDDQLYIIDLAKPTEFMALPTESIEQSPSFFTTKSGKEILAIGSDNSELLLFDLANIKKPLRIPFDNFIYSTPLYFESKDGRELVVVGCVDGYLYFVNLADPTHPDKILLAKAIYNSAIHILTQDNRELIGIKSNDGHFHLVDLYIKPTQREVGK